MLILPVVFLLLGVGTTLLTPAPQVVGDALVAFGTIFMHTWFPSSHHRAPAPSGPEPVTSLSLYRPFVLPPPPPPTKLPFFSPTAVLRFIRPAPLATARLVIRDTPTGYVPVPAAYANGPYELPQFSTCVLHELEQAVPLIILALVSAVIFRLTLIQKFTSFESRNAKERASTDTDALALSTQDTSSDGPDSVDTLVAETAEVFTIVEEQPAAQTFIDQVASSNPASPVTSPVQKPVDLMQTPEQTTDAEATVPIDIPEMSLADVEEAPGDEDKVFIYPGADIVDMKSNATGVVDTADIDMDATSVNVLTGIDTDISGIIADISGITSDISSIAADTSDTMADTTEISTDPADTSADVQRSSPAAADQVPACPSLTGPPSPNIGVDDNVPAHDSLLVDDNFPASDATLTVCVDDNVPAHDDWEEPAPAPVSALVAVTVSESAPVSETASSLVSEIAYTSVSEPAYAPVSAPASVPWSAPTAFLDLPARPASVPPRSVPTPDDINDSIKPDVEFNTLFFARALQNRNSARRSSSVPAARPSVDAHSDSAAGTELDRDDMHIASVPVTHVAASDVAVSVSEDVPVIVADDAATTTEDQFTSAFSDTDAPAIDAAQTSTDEVDKDEEDVFVYPLDAPTPSDSTTADAPNQVRNDTTIGTIDLTTPVRSPEVETTDSAPKFFPVSPIHAANEETAKDTRKHNGTQKTVVAPQQAAEPPKSLNPAEILAQRGRAMDEFRKAASTQVPLQHAPVRGRGLNDSIHAPRPPLPKQPAAKPVNPASMRAHRKKEPKQPEAGPSTKAARQQSPPPGRSINDSMHAHHPQEPEQPEAGPSTHTPAQQTPPEDRSIYGSIHARARPSAPAGHHPVDTVVGQSPRLPFRPPRGARGKGKGKGNAADSVEESSADGGLTSAQDGDCEGASSSGQVAAGSSLNPLAPVFVCPTSRTPREPEAGWAHLEQCGLLRPTSTMPTVADQPRVTVAEAVGPRHYANPKVQRDMARYHRFVLIKDWFGRPVRYAPVR